MKKGKGHCPKKCYGPQPTPTPTPTGTPTGTPTDTPTFFPSSTETPIFPTTLITETSTTTVVVQPSDTSSPVPGNGNVNEGDTWTGDSLGSICPKSCNPFDPAQNFCDITTGCTTTGGAKYNCACRAGYRYDDGVPENFALQFKAPGQPYVYGPPGRSCNTLCKDSLCSEVPVREQCA
ncbi:hypothetical protein P280DRAFT_464926 [Massarina eburnea CBS 473.64]|uniref:Uncharacterized protein n=1 Tax=Massarina eburnea CBS 473.64 TaxID=1395130 RepID=A0A6A6SG43_9PLEO|nr:hypothetical protein P280DRAFT_464926 [Massarina eburnea CBS 473.64]